MKVYFNLMSHQYLKEKHLALAANLLATNTLAYVRLICAIEKFHDIEARGQCYQTFYNRYLQMFVIS